MEQWHPQDSVLGLLLFVLYINDLSQVTDPGSSMYLFSDDTKVYRYLRTPEDKDQLQQDSHAGMEWQLLTSVSSSRSPASDVQYTMGSDSEFVLNWSTAEVHVGVTFEPDMKFK